ncbi:hypothetical protein TREPR_2500 [Treponema primitia ZAS-2]|uniref:GGDEF domain-containing protein n=1 Tax=Treponema primitia (strain ATCC BAA-887 / DSM 12427 / ZAS-2) TaxID=545694 RepID=F5YH05_TREPZ|nr:hypothetical protein [Treponema primitia]AEF85055.1 hypothetical protein TREPR_2500 [Treponema primitia ZAS-2]
MRIKVTSIIAVISIAAYAAAIGTGVIRIFASINERRVVAQREFYDLADIASSAGALGFMEEPFIEAVRDTVAGSETLLGVIITGPYGVEYTYERENSTVITWVGDSPRFISRFGVSREPHFSPLRMGFRNANISAVTTEINYPIFTNILKQSLLMIFAALVLSGLSLLIYSLRIKKQPAMVDRKMQEAYAPAEKEPASSRTGSASKKAGPPPEQGGPQPEPARSAAGKEEDAKGRLEEELRRCSSTAEDLTFVLLELSLTAGFSVGDDDQVYRKFAGLVIQFFNNPGLNFEWGTRGIAVILPNVSLEDGFARADKFHKQILSGLPAIFPHRNDLRIGLAARTGRALAADRLILEASKALERTQTEPDSPIVAFKSDPEKYRAYIKSRGKKA